MTALLTLFVCIAFIIAREFQHWRNAVWWAEQNGKAWKCAAWWEGKWFESRRAKRG
jgi:hypothetical protein